jgi:hypothetical protein
MCEFISKILKGELSKSNKTRAYDCIEILDLIIDGEDKILAKKVIPVKRFLLDLTREK